MSTTPSCGSCGRGRVRDEAYVCTRCADQLAGALRDVEDWLAEELDVSLSRQRGIDYRTVGGGNHGKPAERPLPADQTAAGATTLLRAALAAAVRYCHAQGVRHSSPDPGLPDGKLPELARWLRWRVDGLQLDPGGPKVVAAVTSAVARATRSVDRRVERQYLGSCLVRGCDGGLYARHGEPLARCDECRATEDAARLRDRLLHELDDRLCTAAEIAQLCTYLGLRGDRAKVRNRINVWHKRGRIVNESVLEGDPAFRFGIVWRLLVAEDR